MADFTATVDDTADLTDALAPEAGRSASDNVAVSESLVFAADASRSTIDNVLVTESLVRVANSARLFSDSIVLSDDVDVKTPIVEDSIDVSDQIVSAIANFTPVLSDTIGVTDLVLLEGTLIAFALNDTASVVDSIDIGFVKIVTRSDSIVLSEQTLRTATFERVHSETALVADALISEATIGFAIFEAHALSDSRVRVTFVAPALNNAALSNPANYVFDNVSNGTVDVTPLGVFIPPGQPQPLYVEVDTSEHTDAGTYQVALTAAIRGAAGQFGDGIPYPYVGIGIAPQIAVVIATSRTQAEVHFTEAIADNADAHDPERYTWSGGLQTIAVLSVIGEVVTLQTTAQASGVLYTLTVTPQKPIFEAETSDGIDVTDEVLSVVEYTYLVAIVGNSDELQTSPDGINWTLQPVTDNGLGVYDVAHGLGRYIVAADKGVLTWPGPGQDWSYFQLNFIAIRAVCYSLELNMFVAAGLNDVHYSPAGVGWPSGSLDIPSGLFGVLSIVWSKELGLFVAVGGGSSPYKINTSPDGVTWTGRAHGGAFIGDFRSVTWSAGLGLFIAVGANDTTDVLQTSPDGIVWTPQALGGGFIGVLTACAAKSDLALVVGYSNPGSVPEWQTSPDGVNWTQQTAPTALTSLRATYRDDLGLFLVVGNSGEIWTSPDAVTWTQRPTAGNPTAQLSSVA